MKRDVLSLIDLSSEELHALLTKAATLKSNGARDDLEGKSLALLFQKPSLRTRVSFEVAMRQMGGYTLYLSPQETGIGEREAVQDVARVVSRYVDGIAARVFSHNVILELSRHATVPVVNALSDAEHPCQAMAAMLTLAEHKGSLVGKSIAYIGDGNNVASSLALAAAMTGVSFRIASPSGFELPEELVATVKAQAEMSGAGFFECGNPEEAAQNADLVYTDVWTSMGQEAERARRAAAFGSYQVTEELLCMAHPEAIFSHPLPAHRGEEVTEDVIEHSRSVVFDEAENRLHVQKALLLWMFEDR